MEEKLVIPQIDFKQLLNCDLHTMVICQFDQKYLNRIAPLTIGKIVLLDLCKSNAQDIQIVLSFISKHSNNWKGIEINFTFQNNIMHPTMFKKISQGISFMKNVESLCITMGGVYVSRSWAENRIQEFQEYHTVNCGWFYQSENIKDLVLQFGKIVSLSPNLKRIWVDFCNLGDECNCLLPYLTILNRNLENCYQLQDYLYSMNHCDINDENGDLTQFLSSFECLKNKKHLRKFIMNIANWTLSYDNISQISQIFSNYLTQDKLNFEEFEFDHSKIQLIQVVDNKLNEVQLYFNSFQKLIDCHYKSLKKFYFSIANYQLNLEDFDEIQKIYNHLSKCINLQRLCLRYKSDFSSQNVVEKDFYRQLKKIAQLKHLKLCFIDTNCKQNKEPCLKRIIDFLKLLEERRNKISGNLIIQQAISKENLNQIYRSDILQQMIYICGLNKLILSNSNFDAK